MLFNTKNNFKHILELHCPLIGILLGAFLLWVSLGPYVNWDAQLELEAATNVLSQGFPYISTGYMINQPPLGFYTEAVLFRIFGPSYATGTNTVALFALGSVVLVYSIGYLLYGREAALLAAALFSITPLQVFMSRIFLIDVQCMFFSLLYLFVGILAMQKKSEKLVLLSGAFFALSLLTKLFSVYMLVPLALILYAEQSRGFLLTRKRAFLFIVPTVILQVMWYGGFANQNFLAVYFHSDLTHPIQTATPSILFLPQILIETMGWFFLIGAALSLTLSFWKRKLLAKLLISDSILAVTLLVILGLDLLLVFGFRLNVPYVSALKYVYQALPVLCWLGSSLAAKSNFLFKQQRDRVKSHLLTSLLAIVGLTALAASVIESMTFLYTHIDSASVIFKVDVVSGFPFQLIQHTLRTNQAQIMQLAAITLVILSLALPRLLLKIRKDKREKILYP